MNILFPSESDDTVTSRMGKMDTTLEEIQKVLMEIRTSLDRTAHLERRVEELEKSVARLQSITMDLRGSSTPSHTPDRITPLESMVNSLCTMTAEQKTVLDQLVEAQGKSLRESQKPIRTTEDTDEPVMQEIDEIVRRR